MYEFDAKDYGSKIKKVYIAHFDLRGIWHEDVTNRTTAVGIWPNRSGWGFGWVDLIQLVDETEAEACVVMYEPDEEGNPVIKRRYGLVKLVWHPGALEKEEYRERLGLIKGLSEQDIEDAYKIGVKAGLHLVVMQEELDMAFARTLAEAEEWMKEEEDVLEVLDGAVVVTRDDWNRLVERWGVHWKGAEEDEG